MSDYRVRNIRMVPDVLLADVPGQVGHIVQEMIVALVNDLKRADQVPNWKSLFVTVSEDPEYPNAKEFRAWMSNVDRPTVGDVIKNAARKASDV